MTVWILIESDHDGQRIVGVYYAEREASLARDAKYAEKYKSGSSYSGLGWHVENYQIQGVPE